MTITSTVPKAFKVRETTRVLLYRTGTYFKRRYIGGIELEIKQHENEANKIYV